MQVEEIVAEGWSQIYLFGGLDDGHKLLKFHRFSKKTPTGHFIMALSLRRHRQVLLTGLKEVELFNREILKWKNMEGWKKAKFNFLMYG